MGERLTYTVREAAEVLGVSARGLYDLVARGEFPAVRLGRRVLISRSFVAELLEGDR